MTLNVRLRAAADLVPSGARLADIGSDHAYLPIMLCLENRIECALASDVNSGPTAAAVANIAKNGLSERIRAVCADGLDAAEDFAPSCITVLGMGGELIASILKRADWIKRPGITLVLQPMTHAELLSDFLLSNGFRIDDERIVCDGGRDDRLYRIMRAEYDGAVRTESYEERLIGKKNLERADGLTKAYVKRTVRVLESVINGKGGSGRDVQAEKDTVAKLKSYIGDNI